MTRWTFTSESVSEGHPDKMADQISDSILDAMLAQDPMSRVACETMVTTGLAIVAGEITTEAYVDIPGTVRQTICDIGYDREAFGYDGNTCGVMVAIDARTDGAILLCQFFQSCVRLSAHSRCAGVSRGSSSGRRK